MGLEVAVSPATYTPGVSLKVDLLGGAGGVRAGRKKLLLVGPKTSGGSATQDTLYRDMSGADQVATLTGSGGPLHLAALRLFGRKSNLSVDVLVTPTGAGATATGSHSFGGTPTVAYNVKVEIGDVTINVPWAVGESASTIATRVQTYINAAVVPATAGGVAPAVSLTAKVAGPWGNDIRARITLESGSGGTINSTSQATYTMAGGTTEPSYDTALAAIIGRKYDKIIVHASNAQASTSGSTVLAAVATHIDTYKVGKGAALQMAVFGNTSTAVSSATTGANARNNERLQQVFAMNGRALPVEWAAWEAADSADLEELRNGNPNRIGTVFSGFGAPFDPAGDKPTAAEVETALAGGVSVIDYNDSGLPYIVAPITEHWKDSSGNPDKRALYVAQVTGADTVANDLRSAIEQQFPQKKITADRAESDEDPLPGDTVEIREVNAFVVARLREWVDRGVLNEKKLEESIANGQLAIAIDPDDESQVDIVVPYRIVPPWAKTSLVFKRAS